MTGSEHGRPLLAVDDLTMHFDVSPPWLTRVLQRTGRAIVRAVDGVNFEIGHGRTFSLVGESGCGKSTVARLTQIDGAMPRLDAIPAGCAFNPRCPKAFERCRRARPELEAVDATEAACWLYDEAPERSGNDG